MGDPDRKFVWKEGAKRGAPGWGSMTYYSSGVFNPLAGDWWDRTLHTEPLPQTQTQEQWCWWAKTMGLEELKWDQQETNLHGFSGGGKLVSSNSLWTNGCGATFNCAKQRCKRFTMSRQWQAGMRMNYSAGCSHGDIQWTRLFLSRQFLTLNCVRKSLIQN